MVSDCRDEISAASSSSPAMDDGNRDKISPASSSSSAMDNGHRDEIYPASSSSPAMVDGNRDKISPASSSSTMDNGHRDEICHVYSSSVIDNGNGDLIYPVYSSSAMDDGYRDEISLVYSSSSVNNGNRDLISTASPTFPVPAALADVPITVRSREMKNINLPGEIERIISYRFDNVNLLNFVFSNFEEENKLLTNFAFNCLEYFGDSFLSYHVPQLLVSPLNLKSLYPRYHAGVLTQLRAANVDNEKLARAAVKHGFHHFYCNNNKLLFNKRQKQAEEFEQAILEYPSHSYGLIDTPKFLSDIVEALIGAVHFDCNFDFLTTGKVARKLLDPLITLETLDRNPVTKLQELCQSQGWEIKFDKKDWPKTGEIIVYVGDELVGNGTYKNRKSIATNRAAHDAYNQITSKNLTFARKNTTATVTDEDDEDDDDDDDTRRKEEEEEGEDVVEMNLPINYEVEEAHRS